MFGKTTFLILFGLICIYISVSIYLSSKTKQNNVSIVIPESNLASSTFRIAVLGDLHLSESVESLSKFQSLILQIKNINPDLLVLVGDYTQHPDAVKDMAMHRENIINLIKLIDPIPNAIVLGNYESWSNPEKWLESFSGAGLNVMENETTLIETKNGLVCIRGFGDYYTERFRFVDFPKICDNVAKVSITHDPAAAFSEGLKGLVIAGHTHCGQIRIPFMSPLWIPSKAPTKGQCGLYQTKDRTVYVTSGIGTSILPIRFGTQSEWDMLKIHFSNEVNNQ